MGGHKGKFFQYMKLLFGGGAEAAPLPIVDTVKSKKVMRRKNYLKKKTKDCARHWSRETLKIFIHSQTSSL